MSIPLGATRRLSTTFAVGGVATDPTSVTLTVTDPAGTATVYTYSDTVSKAGTGEFYKDLEFASSGIWAWRWEGTGSAAQVDEGTLTVASALALSGVLCSIDDVKMRMETESTSTDDVLQALIVAASRAIHTHTGREFAATDPPGTARAVDVGVFAAHATTWGIPIGELAAAPTAVEILDSYGTVAATLTPAADVVPMPLAPRPGRPYTHLRLRPNVNAPAAADLLRVTGTWGWPAVPADVAHAAIITVRSWLRAAPDSAGSYDDTFGTAAVPAPAGGWMLPMAAKQLLAPYRRLAIA